MKISTTLLCIIINLGFLNAQLETEINPSGITLPRMTTQQRNSIVVERGTCIYNTNTLRIECCNAQTTNEPCFWGAISSILVDDDLDTYISTRHIDKGDNLIHIRIDGQQSFDFQKDTFYNARIEIPQNFGNVVLGGHTQYDPEGGSLTTDVTDNVFIGYQAGTSEMESSQNVLIGTRAGYLLDYPRNVMIGYQSGPQSPNDINEAVQNTYLGYRSGYMRFGHSNIALGSESGVENSGSNNVFVGKGSGRKLYGHNNIAIGREAMNSVTSPPFELSSDNNIALGNKAGYHNHGNNNVFIGNNAGNQEMQQLQSTVSNTLIINSGEAIDTPLIHGNFITDKITLNGDVGIGIQPTSKLEVLGSVKIHEMLKLTPISEPHTCAQTSHVGDLYLSDVDMVLRICIRTSNNPPGFKWSELN